VRRPKRKPPPRALNSEPPIVDPRVSAKFFSKRGRENHDRFDRRERAGNHEGGGPGGGGGDGMSVVCLHVCACVRRYGTFLERRGHVDVV
jgi:hypothetical protein